MILDVGCGINPTGDVNVDLPMGANYGVTKTRANLYASVYNLPFRNGSFVLVRFNGLLHHLSNPRRAWCEMVRVSRGVIVGVEPNFNLFLPRDKTESHHLYRKRTIQKIIGRENVEIRRIINLVRFGRVNPVDRTWNFFPLILDFLIMAWPVEKSLDNPSE